ncbi:MAG TPA: phosphate ABC transporter substrate-binding protein PstS [Methylomirabilota bacterium]|nr:phosphate ABC transporter substrate-binding protein PstS [Methylomirabilota bacterium]
MKKIILSILGGASLLTAQAADVPTITGAGSTFDYPAFTKWFEAYSKIDPSVQFNYQSIGSGGGIKNLTSQTVDFGASDAPMKPEAMAAAPGKILHIPVVAGGVAVIYNLPGNPKLKLDGEVLAGIYLGNITKWNDPKIVALNSGVDLPDTGIIPVHRSDGSGTSFIFTDYLSAVNPAWADSVGKGSAVQWPAGVGLGAKGSEGVAGQVKQQPGGIGYAELAYADQNKISFADMKNSTGNFISPAPDSVSAALATAKIPDDFRFSMVNAPGEKAYPISGASWVLVYQHPKNAARGQKLVSFLKWAVTEGQKLSPALDYAPLPDEVQQRELKLVDTIK